MLHHLRGPARSAGLVMAGLALLAGCRFSPFGSREPGSASRAVRATVSTAAGAGYDTYEGTGEFGVNDADGVRLPKTFNMNSQATDGRGDRSLMLWRSQAADRQSPPVGTYSVAIPDYTRPSWATLAMAYHRKVDGWYEAYVGQSGTVTVTESSSRRFAGTFRISAVRYYRRPLTGTGREPGIVLGRPDAVPPDQPKVEITGTFSAAPFRDRGVDVAFRDVRPGG